MSLPLSAPPADQDGLRLTQGSRIAISLFFAVILLQPGFTIIQHGPRTGEQWFQLAGAVALTVLTIRAFNKAPPSGRPAPWPALAVILALGIGLLIAGGPGWLAAIAVAAAMCGRYSSNPLPAIVAAVACSLAGLALALLGRLPSGSLFAVVVIAPLAAFFAYSAARRAEAVETLRRTRAELARAAVAEERLRIARDLHDLLGHSLSLITLKAELAGRVIGTDPERAATEIRELESVARDSLSDVRAAVAGYRQPDLAGEIAAARRLLGAAGIATQVAAEDAGRLPQEVDSALAWAVREGATNVVRHSTATQASISVSVGPAQAEAEIRDNGAGPEYHGEHPAVAPAWPAGPASPALRGAPEGHAAAAAPARPRPAFAGSGLAGLAERVGGLGGEVTAGADGRGFLLRVAVPLRRPA